MPAQPSPPGRLDVAVEGDALVLRIVNPDRANALGPGILDALGAELNGPRAAAARAVLLTGSGTRHFSSGIDLADAPPGRLADDLRGGERRLGAAARAVEGCPRPVIAVVNGAAFGGALELAMACDWRIAARGARLGMPAARLGVVYAPDGLRRFVAALGPARTRRLFLTGAPVDAEEALALGLVDQVVDDDALWDAARRAAADVAAGAPLAIAGTRAILRALGAPPADDALRAEADAWRRRAFGSDDHREALAAFRSRRPPEFTGR